MANRQQEFQAIGRSFAVASKGGTLPMLLVASLLVVLLVGLVGLFGQGPGWLTAVVAVLLGLPCLALAFYTIKREFDRMAAEVDHAIQE